MSLQKKIKNIFHTRRKKLSKTGQEITTKVEEIGKEGMEFARDKMSIIGEGANDISNIVRYRMEIKRHISALELEYQVLGEIGFILYQSKKWEEYNEAFTKSTDKIYKLKQTIDEKENAYLELRKRYSNNYDVKKLTDDLGQGDAVISQVMISEKSNMADRQLRDTLLPKEALISVVKRGDEVIIPDGNTKLFAGDFVTVIGREADVEKVTRRLSSG
jgi:uncharacterized protein with PhoU and TrkA domain